MKKFAMKKNIFFESKREGKGKKNNEIQDLFAYRAEAHNFPFRIYLKILYYKEATTLQRKKEYFRTLHRESRLHRLMM